MNYTSGFVTIIGSPNVGKSTLLNTLLGEKIAAVSPRPQTTRTKISGIITDANSQIVLLDTPGIQTPKNRLGNYMKNITDQTATQSDILIYMLDVSKYNFEKEMQKIETLKQATLFLVINKIDLIKKAQLLPIMSSFSETGKFNEIIPLSAKKQDGIDMLIDCLKRYLPQGPKFFPDDIISDQPERQICSELIREKMMRLLGDEIPYGTAVVIEKMEYNETKNLTSITSIIYCERQSHKSIIIGKDGAMLKKIGSLARSDIQKFLGARIFLQLWVKVSDNWRNSYSALKDFGYTDSDL